MENYIYERDYSDKYRTVDIEKELREDELFSSPEFVKAVKIYKIMNELPRPVNPKGKKIFDRLVPKLDEYAQDMGCSMKAEIDYTHNIATIDLTVADYFGFEYAEHFDLITDIVRNSATFSFELTNKHEIRWKIYINYFEDLPMPDNF